MTWPTESLPLVRQTGEVDSIDGVRDRDVALGGAQPALRRVARRAAARLRLRHLLQARAAGSKVVTADLRVIHHHSKTLISDIEDWVDAYVKIAEKWQTEIAPADREEWQRTVLRARAEAAAAKLIGGMADLVRETQEERDAKRIAELEAELERLRA